jgi:hypothetical protein
LRREGKHIDAKVEAVLSGDESRVRAFGAPAEVVGDIARAMICAAPGHRLLIGDFSGIESRILGWISGEQSKLDQWAKFDRTQDKDNDHPYWNIGRALGFDEDLAYDSGKRASFGYQGGVVAYRNYAPADDPTTDEQIKEYQRKWRDLHPRVERFWYSADRAAVTAVSQRGLAPQAGMLGRAVTFHADDKALHIRLPSGRELNYPFPRHALLKLIEAAPERGTRWRRAPIHEWAGKQPPDQEYTVPDRYPVEEAGLLSGEGAIGKSFLLMMLCAAHVLGNHDWMGCTPREGPAICVECEYAEDVLWRRLAAIANYYGVPIETFAHDLHMYSLRDLDNTILATTNKNGIVEPTPNYQHLKEMIGDVKPVQVTVASVANTFAGNEINRTEVQQFVRLMTKLTAPSKCSIILATHPSLTGLSDKSMSHEGLSGSTQWHNAVRARGVFKVVKPGGDENNSADTGLRSLTFHKNQYGPPVAGLMLQWQNGLFVPIEGTTRTAAERSIAVEEMNVVCIQRRRKHNVPRRRLRPRAP